MLCVFFETQICVFFKTQLIRICLMFLQERERIALAGAFNSASSEGLPSVTLSLSEKSGEPGAVLLFLLQFCCFLK